MSPRRAAWRWLEKKIAYSVGFGVVFILGTGAVLLYLHERAKVSDLVVRIAYGAGAPVRKRFLDLMAAEGKSRHLDIRLIPTSGTDETLTAIDQGTADLGLVSGVVWIVWKLVAVHVLR